jgi:membrane protein
MSRRWEAVTGWVMRSAWTRQGLALLRRAFSEFRADHAAQMAAAISFHLLFSVFPLAIAAVSVLGLVTQDPHARDAVATAVLQVVPLSRSGRAQLHDLLLSVGGGAGAVGLLGLAGVVWSASGVMAAVRTALNVAWDTSAKRPFLRGKAVDLLLVAGVFVITGATLGLTVIAGLARSGVSHLPGPLEGLTPVAGAAVSALVFLGSATLLFATFAFLYRLVPAAPTHLRGVWPGALAAALGFEALQFGFSLYVSHFGHYNKVYGSLGAVVAFMFFVYLASMVFLFGAEVAAEYPRLAPGGGSAPGTPAAAGAGPACDAAARPGAARPSAAGWRRLWRHLWGTRRG